MAPTAQLDADNIAAWTLRRPSAKQCSDRATTPAWGRPWKSVAQARLTTKRQARPSLKRVKQGFDAFVPLRHHVIAVLSFSARFYAPFVYRLGHIPFTDGRGVRFSYGVPNKY